METTGGRDKPVVSTEEQREVTIRGVGGKRSLKLTRKGHWVTVEQFGLRDRPVSIDALRHAVGELD